MDRCTACGSTNVDLRLRPEYHYNQFGISATLRYAVIEPTCNDCKHTSCVIPNPEGLDAAIALVRILSPIKLNGSEFRFIRKIMELQASAFAKRLELSPETYSRIENGHQPINEKTEKLFRISAAAELAQMAPAIDFDIKELTMMQITPFREQEPQIELRAVFFKEAKKQQEAWDKYQVKVAAAN